MEYAATRVPGCHMLSNESTDADIPLPCARVRNALTTEPPPTPSAGGASTRPTAPTAASARRPARAAWGSPSPPSALRRSLEGPALPIRAPFLPARHLHLAQCTTLLLCAQGPFLRQEWRAARSLAAPVRTLPGEWYLAEKFNFAGVGVARPF